MIENPDQLGLSADDARHGRAGSQRCRETHASGLTDTDLTAEVWPVEATVFQLMLQKLADLKPATLW